MRKLKIIPIQVKKYKSSGLILQAEENFHRLGKSPYRKLKGNNLDLLPILVDFLGFKVEDGDMYQVIPKSTSLTGLLRILSYIKFKAPDLYEEIKTIYPYLSRSVIEDDRKTVAYLVDEIIPNNNEKRDYLISLINHLKEINLINEVSIFSNNKDEDSKLIEEFLSDNFSIQDILKKVEIENKFISEEDIPSIEDEIYEEIEGSIDPHLDEESFQSVLNISEDDIRNLLKKVEEEEGQLKDIDDILGLDDSEDEDIEKTKEKEDETEKYLENFKKKIKEENISKEKEETIEEEDLTPFEKIKKDDSIIESQVEKEIKKEAEILDTEEPELDISEFAGIPDLKEENEGKFTDEEEEILEEEDENEEESYLEDSKIEDLPINATALSTEEEIDKVIGIESPKIEEKIDIPKEKDKTYTSESQLEKQEEEEAIGYNKDIEENIKSDVELKQESDILKDKEPEPKKSRETSKGWILYEVDELVEELIY